MALFHPPKKMELAELVKACQRQDSRAQAVFYDRYKSKLLGVCLRYAKTVAEAEDIFQEGILRIFAKINDIQNPRPSIAGSKRSWFAMRSIIITR